MRDIEFRGKLKSNNEWIYGYLTDINEISDVNEVAAPRREVDEDTVGQWTGLYDKNNKKMYEGDIVECVSWNEFFSDNTTGDVMEPFRRRMYISFRNGGFKIIEPMPRPMKDNVWDIIYNGDIKVIGNIHDNPELLNKEQNV